MRLSQPDHDSGHPFAFWIEPQRKALDQPCWEALTDPATPVSEAPSSDHEGHQRIPTSQLAADSSPARRAERFITFSGGARPPFSGISPPCRRLRGRFPENGNWEDPTIPAEGITTLHTPSFLSGHQTRVETSSLWQLDVEKVLRHVLYALGRLRYPSGEVPGSEL